MDLKKTLGVLVALVAVAGFSLTAVAEEKGKTEGAKMEEKKADAKAAPKPKDSRMMGATVKAVDAAGKMITVSTKAKKDVMVSVDDKTKIKSGKDDKKLEDLKEGNRVNVVASTVEGKMMAKSITLVPASPAKPKTDAKATGDTKMEEKKKEGTK